jgi:hypothetical protein
MIFNGIEIKVYFYPNNYINRFIKNILIYQKSTIINEANNNSLLLFA